MKPRNVPDHPEYDQPHHRQFIIAINFQILVSVLNPLSPKKTPVEEPVEDQTQPTITLEVSTTRFSNQCVTQTLTVEPPSDQISDRSRMVSWNGFRTDLGSEQIDSVAFIIIVIIVIIIVIIIIIIVIIIVIRFLGSPTPRAASPQSWRCKHRWQHPAPPHYQLPC